jgi:hypothetical protein
MFFKSRQSVRCGAEQALVHFFTLEAVPIGDGMQIGEKNFCLARKKLAGILTDFRSF